MKTTAGNYDVFCIIKTLSEKINSKGEPYLDMTISDCNGSMNAKLWNYKAAEHGQYSVGDVVKLRGNLSQYNGQDQMSINKIRAVAESDCFDYSTVVPSSEYDSRSMLEEIYKILDTVKDPDLKKLTMAILNKSEKELLIFPAAFRLHHAMRGGLLYHTLSILRCAEGICKVYPSIDKDMVYCGAILHDICKIDEFEVNSLGIVKKYSIKGELLGHLVMGAMKIEETAKELGIQSEKITLLEHMIISHHGVPEFGSAIRPSTLEAIVLSMLDTLDATVYEVEDVVKSTKEREFSERQWALDNRKLFNPGLTDVSTKANLL